MEFPKKSSNEMAASPAEQEKILIPDRTHEAELVVESIEIFGDVGLPLHPELREMLSETSEHRFIPETYANNRRGSGFMQATRVLAEVAQLPPQDRLKRLFDEQGLYGLQEELIRKSPEFLQLPDEQRGILESRWSARRKAYAQMEAAKRSQAESMEEQVQRGIRGEPRNPEAEERIRIARQGFAEAERIYEDAKYETSFAYDDLFPEGLPKEYRKVPLKQAIGRVKEAVGKLSQEEDVLVGRMIHDLLEPQQGELRFSPIRKEMHVGTCTTAEMYFLSALNPEGGYSHPTIATDGSGDPCLLLKHAGEHSAITLKECVIDGVRFPAGSLLALTSDKSWSEIREVADCTGAQFLRLTTLAVSPRHRTRAFGMAMEFQKRNGMPGAEAATIGEFYDYAKLQVMYRKWDI